MDRERALAGRTVVVRGGRIAALGPAGEVRIPVGARRVDGRGKFLLPGLVDGHAHIAAGEGTPADEAGRQLALSLANGVTLLRGMGMPPQAAAGALALRERIRRGEVLGPTLVLSAPSIHARNTTTPEQARQRVREAKAAGFDFLKTHGGFSADIHDALASEARAVGLPLAGHVTASVGLDRAMAAGQQVEHLDGVLAKLTRAGAPVPDGQMIVDSAALANVDTTRLPELAREMARRPLYNGPTLAVFENLWSDEPTHGLAARAEMRYVSPRVAQQWSRQRSEMAGDASAEGRRRFLALRRQIVRVLDRAGVPMMAGSDSPQLFMVPGFAVHRELQALVAVGLTPYAALRTATVTPVEYLGMRDRGTVAVGQRADLVLVDADPLADIRNAQRVAGVVVGGRWLPAEWLQASLAEVARVLRPE
ncbi:MAG TPA: amidohydrolase family protein [Gemmatimonadaceae bacterium]|nr:amidohydrolase family protein [Gemmatimonadaceae bacterium]